MVRHNNKKFLVQKSTATCNELELYASRRIWSMRDEYLTTHETSVRDAAKKYRIAYAEWQTRVFA